MIQKQAWRVQSTRSLFEGLQAKTSKLWFTTDLELGKVCDSEPITNSAEHSLTLWRWKPATHKHKHLTQLQNWTACHKSIKFIFLYKPPLSHRILHLDSHRIFIRQFYSSHSPSQNKHRDLNHHSTLPTNPAQVFSSKIFLSTHWEAHVQLMRMGNSKSKSGIMEGKGVSEEQKKKNKENTKYRKSKGMHADPPPKYPPAPPGPSGSGSGQGATKSW